MIPTKNEKRLAYFKWWLAIFPVGAVAVVTPPFIAPIALLVEQVLPKNNPLWWWLDDEIEDPAKNKDWLEYKQKHGWFAWINWHFFRNTMWNLKASLKPKSAIEFCVSNNEDIVDIEVFNLTRNTQPLNISDPCLEMPVVRWIDKLGNATWNTLSGVEVNFEKSVWGEMKYWYKAKGSLYFREGFVREKTGWMLHKKFPFIGKKDYYHIVAKGCNEKRYIYTNKKQIKP